MNDINKMFIVISVILSVIIIGWIGKSYFEMKTFNKFSERKATITDCMFSNFRVTAQLKNQEIK